MDNVLVLIMVCVLIEAIAENVKWIVDKELSKDKIIAFVTAELVVFLTSMNVFEVVQIPIASSIVGIALTGIILARGSNYLHDLLTTLASVKKKEVN